ncbi:hypothetical protein DITRI_Ditri06bG0012600 [Diplodiscus trichospermus]
MGKRLKVLYWLSGLTCTDENFIIKSGAQRAASAEGVALIAPDTSPNKLSSPKCHIIYLNVQSSFPFFPVTDRRPECGRRGRQLGFWCRCWILSECYTREVEELAYVRLCCEELPKLLSENFPQLDTSKASISGHSMGGHGALTIYLKNLDKYKIRIHLCPKLLAFLTSLCLYFAVSICLCTIANPINCPWGQKAFTNYLGDDKTAWEEYDATYLISKFFDVSATILIDQGEDDKFLHDQLLAHKFEEACRNVNAPLLLRLQPRYDHSYFFVSTFIDDHIRHHAQALKL